MIDTTSSLEEEISNLSAKKVLLVEPGGNHGDTLIYSGLENILTSYGISYDVLPPISESTIRQTKYVANRLIGLSGKMPAQEFPTRNYDTVIIHGGGNFSDIGGRGISLHYLQYLSKNMSDSNIILAPLSCWLGSTQISEIIETSHSNNIVLFARERYSRNVLQRQNTDSNTKIKLSPDTAFYNDKKDLENHSKGDQPAADTLLAFRNDKESIVTEKHISDLKSEYPNAVSHDISNKSKYSFSDFITMSNNVRKIFTDRLHVSILGFLLGKEVTLFPNRYYKNRGVYDYMFEEEDQITLYEIGRNRAI